MRKIFATMMIACLLASALCVTAFAAESTAVIKVQFDAETKEFSDFEEGWNYAMKQANDEKEVYVTLLEDWSAKEGKFTDDFFNGAGFDSDTIYFAGDVTITLDLNGFTIDRGLTASELNGEVMFINDDANVTIKNGTIKGGYSSNGAGGIHIEGANVQLIDLVITGNHVVNDDGTALQHVNGGELYMKNCRFVDNDGSAKGLDIYGMVYLDGVDKVLIEDCYFADTENVDYGAGIYADMCNDFVIRNSTFENLHAGDRGGAIWVVGESFDEGFSRLYIYNCKFNNNSCGDYGGAIYSKSTELYVYDTEFKGNYAEVDGGAIYLTANMVHSASVPSYFYRCTFDGNRAGDCGGAIFCNNGVTMMTRASTYGCDFVNNYAERFGGAACVEMDCGFGFFSDPETGKSGTIKNNAAGELGGGIYQDNERASIDFGGEIYASGNVSSAGDDDIYLKSGYYCEVLYSITSPDGSIGIYYVKAEGGKLAEWKDESITVNLKAFFFNNGEFDFKLEQKQANTMGYKGPVYILKLVKKSAAVGSIFGEGSLTMIVAILALVGSGTSIFMIADLKKKLASVTANKESEDEE